MNNIGVIKYFKGKFQKSSFIEENYVDSKNVELVFPDEKRNLIYIFAESYESTFFSKDLGRESDINYLEPITNLTNENIKFSNSEKFGGALSINGTNWTIAGMVAQTSGLPLKLNVFSTDFVKYDHLLDGAIENILENAGYNQMLMLDSNIEFANRKVYFEKHGNYEIFDYNTAKKENKIPSDYSVRWGYEDSKLFEYAKEQLLKLSSDDKPFNLTILTTNTHFPDGYLESDCESIYDNKYFNSLNCSARQINEFVSWIKEQSFYDNTAIVIVGGHVSMQKYLYENGSKRNIYNLFINSNLSNDNSKNREFSSLDMFPTALASIGVEIKGNRLGLGTNLFSDKKALIEEYEYDYFDNELLKLSDFYNNTLLFDKK